MMCITAPKSSMLTTKLAAMVLVMMIANLLKVSNSPPKRKAPHPIVVMVPERTDEAIL